MYAPLLQTISDPLVLLRTFPHCTAHGELESASNAIAVDVKVVTSKDTVDTIEGRISAARPSSEVVFAERLYSST